MATILALLLAAPGLRAQPSALGTSTQAESINLPNGDIVPIAALSVESTGGLFDLSAALALNGSSLLPAQTSSLSTWLSIDGVRTGVSALGDVTSGPLASGQFAISLPGQVFIPSGSHLIELFALPSVPSGSQLQITHANLSATAYQTIQGQPAAVGTSAESSADVGLSGPTPITLQTLMVNSSGGLYNLSASANFSGTSLLGGGPATPVSTWITVDGQRVGFTAVTDLASGYKSLSLPAQLILSSGPHVISLMASGSPPVGAEIIAENSLLSATAFQSIDNQPAALGSFVQSGNISLSSNPTALAALQVDSAGQLFDLSAAVALFGTSLLDDATSSVTTWLSVDGIRIGIELTTDLSAGQESLFLPDQLFLTAGAHTIELFASGIIPPGSEVEASSAYLRATAYQDIPEPTPVLLLSCATLAFLFPRRRSFLHRAC